MTTRKRILIGGIGGLTPVIATLIVLDVGKSLHVIGTPEILGALVKAVAMFLVGGLFAYLHTDELIPYRVFEIGLAAPALIVAMANGEGYRGAIQTGPSYSPPGTEKNAPSSQLEGSRTSHGWYDGNVAFAQGPPTERTTDVHVRLIQLKCEGVQTAFPPDKDDEIYLSVDGRRVWPRQPDQLKMVVGGVADLRIAPTIPIGPTGAVRIDLFEEDRVSSWDRFFRAALALPKPSDDYLGSAVALASQTRQGPQSSVIVSGGSRYILMYKVVSGPE